MEAQFCFGGGEVTNTSYHCLAIKYNEDSHILRLNACNVPFYIILSSFELIQMLQPRKDNLFTGLFNLPS